MADANSDRWKAKYLAALDEQEQSQNLYQAQLEQLRRGIVRVSLAAEGLDSDLDRQLAEMRNKLRDDHDPEELEQLIKELDHSVISLDDRRRDEHVELKKLVEQRLRALSRDAHSDAQKATVGRLQAEAPEILNSNGINPNFWRTLLDLQDSVFQSVASDQASSDNLRDALGQKLLGVLQQLDVPVEQTPLKKSLQARITEPFEINAFPGFLEETAHLVSSTRLVAQKEFEEFLKALHQRLQDVQDFLGSAREGEEQARVNQERLDAEVRRELSAMRDNAEKSADVSQLKLDIEGMVTRIAESVDQFQSEEKQRRESVYKHIESLATRMATMEQEATQLKQTLEAQRLEALKDALTELPNRASYDQYIDNEYSRWQRHGGHLSLAVIDIDHFKKINDTLGHLRGDKVLRLVAREIQKRLRKEDFVARYGGEEFVVVLPETAPAAAVTAMEKIRECIEACPFNFNGSRIPVTASIGIAGFLPNEAIDTCFERADSALYKAKSSGRNQVQVATDQAIEEKGESAHQ